MNIEAGRALVEAITGQRVSIVQAVSYTVPGKPQTWQRSWDVGRKRPTERADAVKAAKYVHQLHAIVAKRNRPWPLDGAFAIDVIGYYGSAATGDCDRLGSLAMDAMEGILYKTDRQVRDVRSRVVADGSHPRVEVTVTRMEVNPVQPIASVRKRAKR